MMLENYTIFEDLNLPFHGVLLDPLIEYSCGPLINYDYCSTFDETSPFLASSSFAISTNEYQLTTSSNTTSLLTCNFRVEGLKHLYHFCSKEYLMKIYFSAFAFSFDFFSLGTCMYAVQPNTLRCETFGLLPVNFSSGVMP